MRAARREQAAHAPEGELEVGGRVEDVRGNDDVEAARREPLLGRVALEVEHRGREATVAAELGRGAR